MPDSTINGLTATTGAAISQTADYFPIWDNAGATTKKINRSELLNGPILGSVGSALRGASSDYSGVVFDGATSGTRITSTLTGQNIGTGDFSVWARFRVPSSAGSGQGIVSLSSSSTSSAVSQSLRLYIRAGSSIAAIITGATASDYRLSDGGNIITTYAGQIIDVVFTRSSSTVAMYINGVAVTLTETTNGTPPLWSDTITSTYFNVGNFDGGATVFSGTIYRSVLFNRALSASNATDLVTNGVDPADQWGTQVAGVGPTTLNGGFETAGAGGADVFADWTESTSGTSTINRDTSIYYAGAASCRLDIDASGSAANVFSSFNYSRGKRFRVSCYARATATNAVIGIPTGDTLNSPVGSSLDNSGWQYRQIEFICGSAGSTSFGFGRYVGTSNGSLWIDNMTVERIGAIVDLDFTVGYGYQAPGKSTNGLHGILINGVSWTNPQPRGILYATTSTNGNQQLLGTLAIPADATITAIYVNSNGGTPTVTMGNASAGTQIFGSTALTGVARQQITPTLPISTTGNLWVNSNSTATLNWTIEYVKSF